MNAHMESAQDKHTEFLLFLCFCVFLLVVELHHEVTAVTENVLFAEPSDDLPNN